MLTMAFVSTTRSRTQITRKSSAVARMAFTQSLTQSLQDERSILKFRHFEVELKELGGEEGLLYHKLVLTLAQEVELPKVVSEGRAAAPLDCRVLRRAQHNRRSLGHRVRRS